MLRIGPVIVQQDPATANVWERIECISAICSYRDVHSCCGNQAVGFTLYRASMCLTQPFIFPLCNQTAVNGGKLDSSHTERQQEAATAMCPVCRNVTR